MTRVMIIRHGEKHAGTHEHGVNMKGERTSHELTVRGWQRAGALVRYFAPVGGLAPDAPISTPLTIFASAATPDSPSLRAQHTVLPLADVLRLKINAAHAEGEEMAVAAAALAAPQPVLISWHHSHIPVLAKALCGVGLGCPDSWPDERFDVVWVLDRDGAGVWRFSQVPQLLFAGDREEPI